MITLETAKALKEAGWDKETENKLAEFTDGSYGAYTGGTYKELYPSPSLEELLAVMPRYVLLNSNEKFVSIKGVVANEMFLHFDINVKYEAYYSDSYGTTLKGLEFIHTDPTEAVAQLWLKLRKEVIV